MAKFFFIFLLVAGFGGCDKDNEVKRTVLYHRFDAPMISHLQNGDLDEARTKILRENGFYYYNPNVKKCYWVVLVFHGVAFDAVDCQAVSDLLINKNEKSCKEKCYKHAEAPQPR